MTIEKVSTHSTSCYVGRPDKKVAKYEAACVSSTGGFLFLPKELEQWNPIELSSVL